MGVPRQINYEKVFETYQETGQIRKTARIMGIHEQTVRSILRGRHRQCVSCPKPAQVGKRFCLACATRRNTRATEVRKERRRLGLCNICGEPVQWPSTTQCETHRLAGSAYTAAHRARKRMVNTMGTTLEAEKELRLRRDYGETAVDCWRQHEGCCVLCGVSYATRAVYIHHLDEDRTNNAAANLTCLCYTCHRTIHGLVDHPNLSRLIEWLHNHYPQLELI